MADKQRSSTFYYPQYSTPPGRGNRRSWNEIRVDERDGDYYYIKSKSLEGARLQLEEWSKKEEFSHHPKIKWRILKKTFYEKHEVAWQSP